MVSGEIDLNVTDENKKLIYFCERLISKPCGFNFPDVVKNRYLFNFVCQSKGESCNVKINVQEGREIRLEPEEAHTFR